MMGSCGKPKDQCTCGSKMTYNRKMSRYRTDNKKPERKFGNQTLRYAGGGSSKAAVQKYAQRYRNIGLNVRVVPHVGGYSLYFGEQIPEDEMVPVDNSETDIASACTELGVSAADLTDEQLNEWRELRDKTLSETQQAIDDMDVLPDDDGDYNDEHEGY